MSEGEPEALARFQADKFFECPGGGSTGNPAEVEVTISCNSGLPLEQSKFISVSNNVTFVVTDFEDGELDCVITEDVPAGYSPVYYEAAFQNSGSDGCEFEDINHGLAFDCDIVNRLQSVQVSVTKEWIDENPQFNMPYVADAVWSCSNVPFGSSRGVLQFFTNPDEDSFSVYPHWDGSTTCDITEVSPNESGVEVDDSDCQDLAVSPGVGASCTIVNTRLYEGIPTLSQYSLAVLALLMLGVGLVGFRRFV